MRAAAEAFWASIVRTATPLVVGGVLGLLTAWNIPLDPEFELTLTALIVGGFQVVWYLLVRVFERYVSPKFGVLLGYAKAPVDYTSSKAKVKGDV